MLKSMQALPQPIKISPESDTQMRLNWNTGENFTLPYMELRFQCPCAGCVDEHTGVRILKRDQVALDIRATGAQPIGRYAIAIQWSDGHSSGIYHFDRLYTLCKEQGNRA